jgi:uncharacterized membrane protein
VAYFILQQTILAEHGKDSLLHKAIGRRDVKGKISPVIYAGAIALSFIMPPLALSLYIFVALMWLVPDRRIEKVLRNR